MGAEAKELIRVFEKETYQALNHIQQEQHPFAFASALTKVAKGAASAVRKQTRREFDLKTEFIPKSIRIKGAKKKDVKNTGKATSVVFTTDKISFMTIHEKGGTRTAHVNTSKDKGKSLVQVGKGLKKFKYKTKTGRIAGRWAPSKLLENYQGSKQKGEKKSGTPMIVRKRKGPKTPFVITAGGAPKDESRRNELEVLYIFTTSATYTPEWEFEETVYDYVERAFPTIYKRELRRAVATAK